MEIIDENDDIIDMQQYARERWQQRQKKYKRVDIKPLPPSSIEEEDTENETKE